MLPGQIETKLLVTKDSKVRLCNDTVTNSYTIGLRSTKGIEWKYISKELYDLLVKELAEQEGHNVDY